MLVVLVTKYHGYIFYFFSDFFFWTKNIVHENKSISYVKKRTSPRSALLNCFRTGHYKSSGKGVRALKSNGTNKIDGACPSQIVSCSNTRIFIHFSIYLSDYVGDYLFLLHRWQRGEKMELFK